MIKIEALTDLNPVQREAVICTEGPLLVLAGAGSGKTRVLTHRIAYILEKRQAQPNQILAVTFTNKAANEMKNRVEKLLGIAVQNLWIGTFHSISARILHREAKYIGYQANFSIYDSEDQENQIKQIMAFLNISKESLTPIQAQYVISDAKNKLIDAKQFEKTAKDFHRQLISKIFWEYETALRRNNAFDFDDLIIKPIEIFTAQPALLQKYQDKFRYILVDEYQDTNKAQYYWIKLFAKKHQNLCVVGDEDQSIYRWRGADLNNILNFEKDYPKSKVIRLEENYRSTQTILSAANAVVSRNEFRLGKNLWSRKGSGERIKIYQTADEISEGLRLVEIIKQEKARNQISLNEVVILYRTNAQSRALEEQLRRNGIPYSIVGGMKFYERKEIKDILAYLKILVNPRDSVSLQRIINFPSRGIGPGTMKILTDYTSKMQVPLYQALTRLNDMVELKPNISAVIQDFHQSLEYYRNRLKELNAYQLCEAVIDEYDLKAIYQKTKLAEDENRLENINELLNSIKIFVERRQEQTDLAAYLDEISLLTDIDRWDPDKPSVTLMTLHSVKGLEFKVVIITGLEDGLMPISRSLEQQEELEEERRLFYVGMTRAKEHLYLIYAQSRHRFGKEDYGSAFRNLPSRFLKEIPASFTQVFALDRRSYVNGQQNLFYPRKSPARSYMENLPDENSQFKIGQLVRHELFGIGQVLGVENSRLGTKLTIQFENLSIKKLIAEYANLTLLENRE
jgi:DNA helicase-2/ATP-dependent DNA helicase PcrA